MSIICKAIIGILGWVFIFFSWNIFFLCILIYSLIICSFIYSKNKKFFIFKLFFLIGFWSSFIIIFNKVGVYFDFTLLNSIMLIFLVNYVDQYSDLNPSNSEHILGVLHDLLKELNIHNIFSGGGGGNSSGPYFFPLDSNEEEDFSFLVIKLNELSGVKSFKYTDSSINSNEVPNIIKKVDDYNKNLVYPKGKEMIEEKNKMISFNNFIQHYFNSPPYGLASINMLSNSIDNWFPAFKENILIDVEKYNKLSLCKFYYESKNKDLLPNKFKNLWEKWHLEQIGFLKDYIKHIENKPNSYINNFFREEIAYAELNDNILIIGAGILCKVSMYINLYNDYHLNLNINKVEFFTKGWEYYQEALQKYYPFFHHYNWFCKLYDLNNFTESDIFHRIEQELSFREAVASLPPLCEYILNEWNQKPNWYNNIRPLTNYEYKEFGVLYRLGLCKILLFNKYTPIISENYFKLFCIKSVNELTGKEYYKWLNIYNPIKLEKWTNEKLNEIFIKKTDKIIFKLIKLPEENYQKQFLKFTKNKQFNIKWTNIEKNCFFKQSLKFTKNTK